MIIVTHLTDVDAGSSTTGNNILTLNITPTTNTLVLACIYEKNATGSVVTPSLSGCNMTFTVHSSIAQDAGGNFTKVTLFRGVATAPTTGKLTFDFGGQANGNVLFSVDQFKNVDLSGTNGSNALVQAVTGLITGTNTGVTVTLAALQNAKNAAYGACGFNNNTTVTKGASFTDLYHTTGGNAGGAEYALNQTAVNWTWGSQVGIGEALAVEIKAQEAFGGAMI